MHPALRKNISHGAGNRLETLPGMGRRRIDNVVKDQVPLVERIAGPRELDRAASVLAEKTQKLAGSFVSWNNFLAHELRLTVCSRAPNV